MFPLFPIIKTNANYAEICRVGNFSLTFFEADFNKIRLFNFLKFSQSGCEKSIIQNQQRKVKTIFLDKNSKIQKLKKIKNE